MNIKMLPVKLFLLVLLAFAFNASPLFADCFQLYHSDDSSDWTMNISAEYKSTNLESTDQYLSGPSGTEDWQAMHDLDGDLYGFSINATPPILGKRITVDFSYLTGDLSGTFNTREIAPTPEGPYDGTVKFDRDEWELGADVFILNAVYARLEYSTFKMDGDWVYTGGFPNEPQKYEYNAYSIGVGFRQNYFFKDPDTAFKRNIGLLVDVFISPSFFEYKHTEQLTGASVKTDDIGYKMRAELFGTYKLNALAGSKIYAGVGYAYNDNSANGLDLTEKGFTAKLGIKFLF